MNINTLHKKLVLSLLSVISLLGLLSACIDDYEACPVVDDDSGLMIRFQIMTKGGSDTRAADISGDIDGSGAENYLNVTNIKYLVFDKDRKFLCELNPDANSITHNEYFTIYDVVAKLDDSYFKDNINGTIDFFLLVIANYSPWNIGNVNIPAGTSMADVFNSNFTMSMSPTASTTSSSSLLQPVTNATSTRFPMVGLQRFTIAGSMLLTANEYMPYDLTLATGKYVNMLRSLTKIEIIDRIGIGELYVPDMDAKRFRITEAQLNGLYSQGSLLPAFNQWNNTNVSSPETQQVKATTIPSTAEYILPPVFNDDFTLGESVGLSEYAKGFAYDEYATNHRVDKCRVYSCYAYEYSKPNGVNANQQPYFTVTVEGPGKEDGTTVTLQFPVRMAIYNNGIASSANNLDALLRNHIYRFEISDILQNLTVDWTVCEMDEAEASIEFN